MTRRTVKGEVTLERLSQPVERAVLEQTFTTAEC